MIQNSLLNLVDEDTAAFNRILEAFSLPKKSEEEKKIRHQAVQDATKNAILIPFSVMEKAFSGFELIKAMAEKGNPNSITDAGVGALAIRACIRGAFLNVKINASSLEDKEFVKIIIAKGKALETNAEKAEAEILTIIGKSLNHD